jgi:alkylation response protein AidB-like acyl-CoA dehydrogenase
MDLQYSDQQQAFRLEVRSFIEENLSPQLRSRVCLGQRLTKQDHLDWHALLHKRGWLGVNWPKSFGGTGWSAIERHIFEEETSLAYAPRIVPFGLNMLGPVLQKFGSKQQQERFLPRILNGDDWWCQGYSEPDAGSDLVSVRASAVRQGDYYVVNGQKTWTTLAQYANWIFCLVRTDTNAKPYAGISFLLIEMDDPGITVRPIELLDGEAEVNEVFFDNVRVPVENLVGEENKGWSYAKYLLTHERTNIAGVGLSNAAFSTLKNIASTELSAGKPLIENTLFASRLAQVEIDLLAMTTTNLKMISQLQNGEVPGAESSVLKIKGTEIRQEINNLTRRAVGRYATPFLPEALQDGYQEDPVGADYSAAPTVQYFNNRKLSIFGGSNEIQKNIISKAILTF